MLRLSAFLPAILIVFVSAASQLTECEGTKRGLEVKFGALGLQQLAYDGTLLEDTVKYPADNFHVWHMKMTTLKGVVLSNGQNGWGENNDGKSWDAETKSWEYHFRWGLIKVQYLVKGDTLSIDVTETNKEGSEVILDGASIYPLALHFAQLPRNFESAGYPQLNDNVSGPSVLAADYALGMVSIVAPDLTKPLYSGLTPTAPPNTYSALISSTAPSSLAAFKPHYDRPVRPGETDHFSVELRFARSGASPTALSADIYRAWARTWPPSLRWKDRRIIGTVYLASSAAGDPTRPHGFSNNPRRYFNDDHADDFGVNSSDGLRKFRHRTLDQAQSVVENLRRVNAQGVITWDIEGEEYPQQTSYVCSPDQIASLAPEMETVVDDHTSRYFGLKLDDAYFKTIHDAGFRVGVCIRPQHFTRASDGSAKQAYLGNSEITGELIRKIKYAHDRWSATLFYIDSTVDHDGATFDASILKAAAQAFPDSLLIPEESNERYYSYSAPFHDFLFHGMLGTDPGVIATNPSAFSCILINDVDQNKLSNAREQLTRAVALGDVLMVHADYWQTNNAIASEIYLMASKKGRSAVKVR